jgi:hypothetical protein
MVQARLSSLEIDLKDDLGVINSNQKEYFCPSL